MLVNPSTAIDKAFPTFVISWSGFEGDGLPEERPRGSRIAAPPAPTCDGTEARWRLCSLRLRRAMLP